MQEPTLFVLTEYLLSPVSLFKLKYLAKAIYNVCQEAASGNQFIYLSIFFHVSSTSPVLPRVINSHTARSGFLSAKST